MSTHVQLGPEACNKIVRNAIKFNARNNSAWNALMDAFKHLTGLTDPENRHAAENAQTNGPCKLCGELLHTTFGGCAEKIFKAKRSKRGQATQDIIESFFVRD